jgi:hypothetical protein
MVAVERREVGGAYSLFGRGDDGGRAREVVLVRAALSVSVGWWEESGFGLKTLRRRRSRGMTGTRNYIYKRSGIEALRRWWWLYWYRHWQVDVQRIAMVAGAMARHARQRRQHMDGRG